MSLRSDAATPPGGTLDVQKFLDTHPLSSYQWIVIAVAFCVVLLDGFDTAAIGYIAPSLLGEWGLAKPDLAPVLSAALFGLAAGALTAGPLADRFGRKHVLLASVMVMGGACLISASVGSLTALTTWRFITGLGLGAAMPNAVTLVSEFCPASKRSLITNAMFCGFPLGAALGGFLAAWMIPQFGWRSVLVLGGVVPLLLVVVMLAALPESIRYMVTHGYPEDRIRKVLRHISASADAARRFVLIEPEASGRPSNNKKGLALILSAEYLAGSLTLWVGYFMGLVIFYGLINWMPVLFKEGGIPTAQATLIAALFPLGGVGAVFSGWLMDRYNANLTIAIGYALTAITVYLIGQTVGEVGLLMLTVFVSGTLMNTAQSSMPALAAMYYPTRGRATGVSWMLGVGRFGGIAGSFLVAELARRHLGFAEVFLVLALPGLVAAVALVVKQLLYPESNLKGPVSQAAH